MLSEKNQNDQSIWNYFTCLDYRSTDSSIRARGHLNILRTGQYLKARFLILSVNVANVPGILALIEDAFKGANCKDFIDELVGMNVDGASMNLDIHKGAGMFLKKKDSQIQEINCLDHRIELALEGAFRTPSFNEVGLMLYQLYYLYQDSPKRELRELSEAYGKAVPKPSRALGTHWIERKYRTMKLFFKTFWPICQTWNSLHKQICKL